MSIDELELKIQNIKDSIVAKGGNLGTDKGLKDFATAVRALEIEDGIEIGFKVPKTSDLNHIIHGMEVKKYRKSITIPEFQDRISVTKIANDALRDLGLESITITNPSKIKTIGDYAFANNNMNAANFGTFINIEYIGDYAFANNNIIKPQFNANNNKKLRYIGKGAFENNGIDEPYRPGMSLNGIGMEYIGEYAFRGNNILRVLLPSGTDRCFYHSNSFDPGTTIIGGTMIED